MPNDGTENGFTASSPFLRHHKPNSLLDLVILIATLPREIELYLSVLVYFILTLDQIRPEC